MRASVYLLVGLAVAMGGCTFKNSCKKGTVLVTATFDGTARTADEFDVIVQIDQGSTVELPSGRVTTMIGARRQWTARPGVGWAAAVNTPFIIAFDPTSHALLFTDPSEDVIWKVQ